jgi:hypothetical protein
MLATLIVALGALFVSVVSAALLTPLRGPASTVWPTPRRPDE